LADVEVVGKACRILTIEFADATTGTANFRFP
jgi:hypothetical protein